VKHLDLMMFGRLSWAVVVAKDAARWIAERLIDPPRAEVGGEVSA
jgi:hypothetical protein